MPSLKRLVLVFGILVVGWAGVGCIPPGSSSQDEEGDPDFRVGMNRKQAGNYQRAIESFERALQRNPQSVAAHYELGFVYFQNVTNYVAAIYHFDRVLRLRPGHPRRDVLQDCMRRCKQELVQDAMTGFTAQMQRELERLERATQENANLRLEVAQLRAQLGQREAVVAANPEPAVGTHSSGGGAAVRQQGVRVPDPREFPGREGARTQLVSQRAAMVYRIKAGDTLYSIAKLHNLSAEELMAANPGVMPRGLKLGQEIRIPAR